MFKPTTTLLATTVTTLFLLLLLPSPAATAALPQATIHTPTPAHLTATPTLPLSPRDSPNGLAVLESALAHTTPKHSPTMNAAQRSLYNSRVSDQQSIKASKTAAAAAASYDAALANAQCSTMQKDGYFTSEQVNGGKTCRVVRHSCKDCRSSSDCCVFGDARFFMESCGVKKNPCETNWH